MLNEKSIGAVVFRKTREGLFYLLLHYKYKSDYWEFARGNIKGGENEKDTAKREIKEETGLDAKILDGFRERVQWFYRRDGELVNKEVIFFLAEADSGDVKISDEHIGFEWLPFTKAIDYLAHENSKNILRKAQDFLSNIERSSLKRWTG